MKTPLDFNFEKGINVNKTVICFSCQGATKIIHQSFSLLISCLPSTTHNLYYWKEQFNVPYRDEVLLISLLVFCWDETIISVKMVFFISFKFNRVKVICFLLLICTVKLIKFELKLNLISICYAVEDHSIKCYTIFESY